MIRIRTLATRLLVPAGLLVDAPQLPADLYRAPPAHRENEEDTIVGEGLIPIRTIVRVEAEALAEQVRWVR